MARIFPERFPEHLAAEPGRRAERVVYDALRDGLSSRYTVLYSVAWLTRTGEGTANDGEVDFLVLHPDRGALLLEVKGGAIRHDAKTGRWYSFDRKGARHGIHDPFDQVRRSSYALREKARTVPRWRQHLLGFGRAVCFPDLTVNRIQLRPDAPREVVVDRRDLHDVEARIEAIFSFFWDKGVFRQSLGQDGVAALVDLLARSFTLEVPLGERICQADRQIMELTEEQFRVLDLLARKRRAAITGGAGTGKTLLAMEKARRLAAEGYRTLLTCFNRPLADWMRGCMQQEENLVVENFHGLCAEAARDRGLTLRFPSPGDPRADHFWTHELPATLLEALDQGWPRFDAVVIDEGQDFHDEWLTALDLCLADVDRGREEAVLYGFHDPQQGIFRREASFLDELDTFPLTWNLRNTRQIHKLAATFNSSAGFRPGGPEGIAVEHLPAAGATGALQAVEKEVRRLIFEEVPVQDIAVLTCRKVETALDGLGDELAGIPVTSDIQGAEGHLLVTSVWRFKGLEKPVIVLVVPGEVERPKDDPVLYVGISRARCHMVVIGADPAAWRALAAEPVVPLRQTA